MRKRSKSTTNYLQFEKELTSYGICEIIKQCGESGVAEFKYGNFHITFQARNGECIDETPYQSPGQVTAIAKVLDEDELIKLDEINAKEEDLAQIKLQDPLQYEELLACQEFDRRD